LALAGSGGTVGGASQLRLDVGVIGDAAVAGLHAAGGIWPAVAVLGAESSLCEGSILLLGEAVACWLSS